MSQALLEIVRRYADTHADSYGVAETPVAGLKLIRASGPGELRYAINRPLVSLLIQGKKRVTAGTETFEFGAGESLLVTADVPTVSQITRASADMPYYALVLELQPAVIAPLVAEMGEAGGNNSPVRVVPTEADMAETAVRLMNVLDRPDVLPVLQEQLVRELHFWLLAGRHGAAMRGLGVADSHARRIGRAVVLIRDHYTSALGVERLAEEAGMSLSSFHHHFRSVTSLSPLQFQKQLRLIEARRRMMSEGQSISAAAYGVGYESVNQFTREYGRLFGQPPMRDIRQARMTIQQAT